MIKKFLLGIFFVLLMFSCTANVPDFSRDSEVTNKITDKNDVSVYTVNFIMPTKSGKVMYRKSNFIAPYSFAKVGDHIAIKDNKIIAVATELVEPTIEISPAIKVTEEDEN